MKIEATVTISCRDDGVIIEIYDYKSSTLFVRVNMEAKQFVQALGRLSNVECKEVEVFGLEKIGKTMEHKKFQFEVPADWACFKNKHIDQIREKAASLCPVGWIADTYYGSQDSFLIKDDKYYANVTIRRWV